MLAVPRSSSWRGGGPGGVASEGRPPAPCHAWKHRARSGQPGDCPLRVRWPLPNGEDGPLGTSLPGPRASLRLRPPLLSLCSLLVTSHRGAETSRLPARPLAHQASGEVQAGLVNNPEKQLEATHPISVLTLEPVPKVTASKPFYAGHATVAVWGVSTGSVELPP